MPLSRPSYGQTMRLSAAERERLNSFPAEIGELDLATYFTLTVEDRALIEQRRGPANRLGFALQL